MKGRKIIAVAAVLVLLLTVVGCGKKESTYSMDNLPQYEPSSTAEQETSKEEETSSEAIVTAGESSQPSLQNSEEESGTEEKTGPTLSLTVEPGSYTSKIMESLVSMRLFSSVSEILDLIAELPLEEFPVWGTITRADERAFLTEGYIAPGTYDLPQDDPEEALKILLHSYDAFWTEERIEEAKAQGYTIDEIMIMASIVEFESSKDPTGEVKPKVAAVVRNRVEMPMGLEMDVTVFYLQEALLPYRNPADYEAVYDTYETALLPVSPICSPSEASILAVLSPAETNDLYFIYDAEGNYYFAEDYETHLVNCELYLWN